MRTWVNEATKAIHPLNWVDVLTLIAGAHLVMLYVASLISEPAFSLVEWIIAHT